MKTKITDEKILLFVNELKSLLSSGIIFSESLKIIYSSEKDIKFRNILKQIYKNINQGNSIFKSFLPFKNIFGINFIYMIKVGEISGDLEICLNKIYTTLEYNLANKKKIRALLIYPMVILTITFISITFLLIFILPNFISIFQENEINLPTSTKILLALSKNFHFILIFFILILVLFPFFINYINNNNVRKFKKDMLLLKIPILGNLFKLKIAENFYYSLYTFLAAGINILDSIDILYQNEENYFIKENIKKIYLAMLSGTKIATSIKNLNLFTERFNVFIISGEESGSLTDNFLEISKILNKEYDYKLKKIITLIEPLSILILGLIILFVVLAIYLPILSINNIF